MKHFAVFCFLILMLPVSANADNADRANTTDMQAGTNAGRPTGNIFMNAPCVYGDTYHFQIRSNGELRTDGPQICGQIHASGGNFVCHLNPQFQCSANGAVYTVNEKGVVIGATTLPWINPQEAAVLFPQMHVRADNRCATVLFWQSKEKQFHKTPSAASAQEQTNCQATLQHICAAAGNNAAVLPNGKDISVLCH
jgi:hypothetical protein